MNGVERSLSGTVSLQAERRLSLDLGQKRSHDHLWIASVEQTGGDTAALILGFHATKLVVRDADAAERFYSSLGLKVVARNVGGEREVRQKQAWLSVTGDSSSHMLILSQFLEVPLAEAPPYPREVWLAFNVADVEGTLAAVQAGGGTVLRPGEDRPEHDVRAAVVGDLEGHVIEIVGPMSGAPRPLADPFAGDEG